MTKGPAIAAVVATYNQEAYIGEAVLSLAGQVDEIVVVDDRSTDGTLDALSALSVDNLRIIHNETQLGVSRSFARAVAATSAAVLLIQGGDDRSLPERAEIQTEALADRKVSFVHSVPLVIDAGGRRLPSDLAAEFLPGTDSEDPLGFLFFESNFICAPSVALRREDYVRLGGFPAGLDLLQDYALWLDLAAGGSVIALDEPVVEYRKHGSNLSREYVGFDAPKERRLAAERSVILRRFLGHADSSTLRRLAGRRALDLEAFAALDRPAQVAMIQLSHRDKLVVRQGLDYLFDLATQPDAETRFAGMGLTLRDLGRFAIAADHENLEAVGAALGVADRLAELNGMPERQERSVQ